MSLRNTPEKYGVISKLFHWVMFVLIVSMIFFGMWMSDLAPSVLKIQAYFWHKSTGILILFLLAARLCWKWTNLRPLLPTTLKQWQLHAIHMTHTLLYFMMFLMPVSGWMMNSAAGFDVSFYGLFSLPLIITPNIILRDILHETHIIGAYAFILLISGHIGAAFLHHFYYRDTVLKKMLPWSSAKESN